MKKEYRGRIVLLLLSIFIIIFEFIYNNYFCFSGNYSNKCFFLEFRNALWEPFVYFFISVAVISAFLFLVKDKIFYKWIKFAIGYAVIAWFVILSTPVGMHSFNPIIIEREQVSIWMSSLFLVSSLVLITFWSIKERKAQHKPK
ncbi:MAG: hypothetical protein V3574_04800 [Candidatus Moraniibacteriota bacterium]